MIRATEKQMYATVRDSRDEEFAASAGWSSPPHQLHWQKKIAQKDAREFTEKLAKCVTFSSRIFVQRELNACPK